MNAVNKSAAFVSAIAAVLALGACQRSENEPSASERMDSTVASAEQKATELKKDIDQATNAAGAKLKDASITTEINAALARDAELSALKINVDTTDGHVVLHGTAPNTVASERAESLAKSVSGVMTVENQLSVRASG